VSATTAPGRAGRPHVREAAVPSTPGSPVEQVYVWEVPVRLSHWLIVLSIVVLSITGIYIGNPFLPVKGEATRHFVMGTMKSLHWAAGMVFVVAVFARVVWMFTGNAYARWYQFVPVTARRIRGVWTTFAYYVFLRREPPMFVGHNPLAGLAYTAVFGLYFVMIVTGLALASAGAHVDSLLSGFQFLIPWLGGLQMARFVHHVTMWLLLGFAAHHVWSAFLIGTVERTALMDSIFSGHKVLPPEIAERVRNHHDQNGKPR
jgi:Ni/Fe-hydrogenase 1 B-type cytochrome subunit